MQTAQLCMRYSGARTCVCFASVLLQDLLVSTSHQLSQKCHQYLPESHSHENSWKLDILPCWPLSVNTHFYAVSKHFKYFLQT